MSSMLLLPLASTISLVVAAWYLTTAVARQRDDPVWYDRAEIIGGAAGLVSIVSYLPIATALAEMFLLQRPRLWALRWTLIGTVCGMMLTIGAKVIAERNDIWTAPDGVDDRRRIDIHGD